MRQEKLSELLDISIGRTPSRSEPAYWGKGHRWVSIRDLSSKTVTETKEQITDLAVKETRGRIVKKGTLLFSFKLTIGKMAFAGSDLFTNEAIAAFFIKDERKLNSEFLYYALQSATFGGSNQAVMGKTLNSKSLAQIEIPLPPLDDQIRIAHLLDKVEGLIAQRKQHLQLLDDLLKSVFLEMFGGANKGAELSIGAAIKQGYILLHKDGNHGSNYPRKDEFGEFGVPFITAKSIDDFGHLMPDSIEHLNEEKAAKLTIGWIEEGDVLLAHNATVGRVGLYRGEFGRALIGTSLTAFRTNKDFLNPFYLHELLRSHFFQQQLFCGMGQATRNQVPITAQRELLIRVPELTLQDRFAVIFEKVESIKSRYQKSLTDLETLYGALSQQAFKGELDLSRVPLQRNEGAT